MHIMLTTQRVIDIIAESWPIESHLTSLPYRCEMLGAGRKTLWFHRRVTKADRRPDIK
jgi:hypothetical protein